MKDFEKNIENQKVSEIENIDQYLDLDIRTPISKESEGISDNAFLTRGLADKPLKDGEIQHVYKGRCCKLNIHNWMEKIPCPPNMEPFSIVEVRFKNSHKEFFTISQNDKYQVGDIVAVEATQGHDIGIIDLVGYAVKRQLQKKDIKIEDVQKKVYRRAKVADIEKWVDAVKSESEIMLRSRYIAWDLQLNMKVNDVEFQGDGIKAVFYYSAEDRVDFRELIKILADQFKIKIEMKQIGVRQEAARLGGLGACGRELCCATWLSNFQSVSTTNARTQQLSLNPQKLAGQCGKLKCCLNYEQAAYQEEIKQFPEGNTILYTKKGKCVNGKIDIFKKVMWYFYVDDTNTVFAISVDNVKKIIAMNLKGEYPDKLEDFVMTNMANTDEAIDTEELKKIESEL